MQTNTFQIKVKELFELFRESLILRNYLLISASDYEFSAYINPINQLLLPAERDSYVGHLKRILLDMPVIDRLIFSNKAIENLRFLIT